MKRALLVFAMVACSKQPAEKKPADEPVIIVTHDEISFGSNAATKPVVAAGVVLGADGERARADRAWNVVAGPGDLAAYAKAAIASGLKPYAYLHAEWCGPCKAIEKTHAADPQMVDAFKGTAIALIDIDAVDPKVLTANGLESSAIPVFFKLDASGKPTGDRIDGGAWGDNVPENMAPPLKAFFAK